MKRDHNCEVKIREKEGMPKRPCIKVAIGACARCLAWFCYEHLKKGNHDCKQMDIDREIAPALNDMPRVQAERIQAILSEPDDWREVWK
jgi:hypothetical protein